METFFTDPSNQDIYSRDASASSTPGEASSLEDEAAKREAERLRDLERYAILDTVPEAAYEDIVLLAAHICEVPIAMISFIDRDRQWIKAAFGFDLSQTSREYGFCPQSVLNPTEISVVPDTLQDARFVDNPFVRDAPYVRFYANAPLITPAGHVLGTVCVFDLKPRQLSATQQQALGALARQVMAQLELRFNARRLEETQQQFRTFTDNTPMLTFIKDENGYYEYVNKPFLRRFNFSEEDVVGKIDSQLWDSALVERIRTFERQVLESGDTCETLEVTKSLDGSDVFWRVYKFPLFWQGHRAIGGIAVDISESKRYERELEAVRAQLEATNATLRELSTTDELTNTHNRRSFIERLRIEWERATRLGAPLSLLMVDADHFKAYNDSFGHLAGDAVLQQLASLLCETARSIDVVARYGGEEFAVILPDADSEGAYKFAERFRVAIESANWPRRNLTVSVGVATRTPQTEDAGFLLDRADNALYRAKRNGRNRVEIAT